MQTFPDQLPMRTHIFRVFLCLSFLAIALGISLFANELLAQELRAEQLHLFSKAPTNLQTLSSKAAIARLQSVSQRASRVLSDYSLLNLNGEAFRTMLTQNAQKKERFSLTIPLEGRTVTASLRCYNGFSPNATFTAKTATGDVPIRLEDDFMLLRGAIEGDNASEVNMSISGGKILMTLRTEGKIYTIESAPAETSDNQASQTADNTDEIYVLYSSDATKETRDFSCSVESTEGSGDSYDHSHNPVESVKSGSLLQNSTRLVAEIAVEIDLSTYQALGSNQAQSVQWAGSIVAAISAIYERDINTQLVVSSVQVWTTTDPYAALANTGDILPAMRSFWNTSRTGVQRDLAHLFTRRSIGGGRAYLNALCSNNIGYGVSGSLSTGFPANPAWTTMVIAHELGHNFGSPHTHDCSWAGGPIDRCATSSCVPAVVPSRGTIMSYCHTQAGGMNNIDMAFHPLCIALMRSRAEAASCLSSGGVVVQNATITSFTPTSGSANTQVVITGTNFTGATSVRFGGVAAQSFTVNSSTQITAQVANGATGTIHVVTPVNTAASATNFTYIPAPQPATITSFSPASAAQGTFVTITGTNFTGATAVRFGGVPAQSFFVNSATQIVAVVAAGATGQIQVTTPVNTAVSTQTFTFIPLQPSPTITSFSPASGIGGAVVTINGTNFTNVNSVRFGGVPAQSFTIQSATRIIATVSASGATGRVQVFHNSSSAMSATNFTFTGTTSGGGSTAQNAAITAFSPINGNQGTAVIITGTNFTSATSVRFGGVPAQSFIVSGSTQILAVVGAGASGQVQVQTPTNTATSTQTFTFSNTNSGGGGNNGGGNNGGGNNGGGNNGGGERIITAIAAISPLRGGQGSSVIITGENFVNVYSVRFGGVPAQSFVVNSAHQITAIVGAGASGTVEVGGFYGVASSQQAFTFTSGVVANATTISFPPVRINSTITLSLTLRNTATSSVKVRSIQLLGANASEFGIVTNSHAQGATLGVSETQTITLRYRPTSSSASNSSFNQPLGRLRTAFVRLQYDGQSEAVDVELTGAVDTTALMVLNPRSLTLPVAQVGSPSAPVAYQVQSWGLSEPLSITVSGDVQIAHSSSASWGKELTFPAPVRLNDTSFSTTTVWVRSLPTRNETVAARITHRSGNYVVPVEMNVLGLTQTVFFGHLRELHLGSQMPGAVTVASYHLQASNLHQDLILSASEGLMISMGLFGPWSRQLTLNPLQAQISQIVYVRAEMPIQSALQGSLPNIFQGEITHRSGATSSTLSLRATLVQSVLRFINLANTPQAASTLQFGYVPPYYASMATYRIEGANITSPVAITATDGFRISLGDDGNWRESLTFSPQNDGRVRQLVFVRFVPTRGGIFNGALQHFVNGTIATLRTLGTSLKPSLRFSREEVDFGFISHSDAAVMRSYTLNGTGVNNPVQIEIPSGLQGAMSPNGPWEQSLTLTPRNGEVSGTITLRTTKAVAGVEYRDSLRHRLSEGSLKEAQQMESVFMRALANVVTVAPLGAAQTNTLQSSANTDLQAQSFPNPFSEETRLEWLQTMSGAVRILISSSNGALVRSFLLANAPQGRQNLTWDGRDDNGRELSNGAYFAQIIVEGKMLEKRIGIVIAR